MCCGGFGGGGVGDESRLRFGAMDFSSFFPRFIDGRIRSVFPDGAWFGGDGVVFVE